MMAGFGVMVGMVGMDAVSGQTRFTFGVIDFYDGIGDVRVMMGIYGVGEVLSNVGVIIREDVFTGKVKGLLPNKEDWKSSAMPIARGTLFGFFLGIIPGCGTIVRRSFPTHLKRKSQNIRKNSGQVRSKV